MIIHHSINLLNSNLMLYEYNAIREKCPLPLVKLRLILKKMKKADVCLIQIADSGSKKDIPALLDKLGYIFSEQQLDDVIVELHIKTGK